jgi:hypothetical protein
MSKRTVEQRVLTGKPKVSDLRARFEFIKASFEIENIHFSEEELRVFENSISKRHRGPGFLSTARELLKIESA